MSSLPSGTVTFLFTDIEGSTKLWEKHPEGMKSALAKHDSILKEAVESNNGQIIKTTGDGVHAVFSTAIDSVNAALDSQRKFQTTEALETSAVSIRVRMGVHTGEAELRDGDYYGSTLNRAARIMSVGHGGQILISETTHQIALEYLSSDISILDLGEHRLKGIAAPEHIYQLCHPDLVSEFPPLNSLAIFKHNLQRQLSTFIGREKELADIKRLLKGTQLLTLLGPGGTGKTRLTLQVAEEVIEDYSDGVWLVELAPLTDPDLIPERVANALNIQEQPGRPILDTLPDFLLRKELLLILDNVEHLVRESAALTEHLLKKCPKLKILVTGREALFIGGETTIQVPSLSLPKEKESPEEIAASEGVQLFLERARSVRPEFELNSQNAAAIAEIVRRLDGIPLAIELAASRLRMLSVEQITERLNNRFRLLTGGRRTALPRQQTLEALIDWSWQLLDESEHVLLRRLSVFSGGWTLDAAQDIAGFDPLEEFAVFDILDQLINKSLVSVDHPETGEARYGMLESIRQFSRDKLFEAGESEALRDRHAEFYVSFTLEAEEEFPKKDALKWVNLLRQDLDNLRTVMAWTQDERPDLALKLVGHLRYNRAYWMNPREADSWFKVAIPQGRRLAATDISKVDLSDLLRALLAHAFNETLLGRNLEMRMLTDEAVALARQLDHDQLLAAAIGMRGLAYAFGMTPEIPLEIDEAIQLSRENNFQDELATNLIILGGINFLAGNHEVGDSQIKEAVNIRRELGSPFGISIAEETISALAWVKGDWELALESTQKSLESFEKIGDSQHRPMTLSRLGHIYRKMGRISDAKDIYKSTIRTWQEFGNIPAVAHQLECFAYLTIAEGDTQRGALLIGAASAIRERLNAPIESPLELPDMAQAMKKLDEAFGEEARIQIMAKGAKMSLAEAILFALEDSNK